MSNASCRALAAVSAADVVVSTLCLYAAAVSPSVRPFVFVVAATRRNFIDFSARRISPSGVPRRPSGPRLLPAAARPSDAGQAVVRCAHLPHPARCRAFFDSPAPAADAAGSAVIVAVDILITCSCR